MFDADFDFDIDEVNFGDFDAPPCAAPKRKSDGNEGASSCKKPCGVSGSGSEGDGSETQPVGAKKVVQRRFPGPAGLLAISGGSGGEKQSWRDYSLNRSVADVEVLCSQTSAEVFMGAPWRRMLRDFDSVGLPHKYDIDWIKKKAKQKKLVDQKAPFLAAVIESIECHFSSVTLTLRDPTGEIQGHMPSKLYKDHTNELVVGAVVVLRQAAVLTLNFGQSHYLIVTQTNLIRIYCPRKRKKNDPHSEEVVLVETQNIPLGDLVKTINDLEKTQNISLDNLVKAANDVENSQGVQKTREHQPQAATKNLESTNDISKIAKAVKKKFDFKSVKEHSAVSNLKPKLGNVFDDPISDLDLTLNEVKVDGDETPVQNSQIVIKSQNPAHVEILQSVFEGVDADSFFDDF